jgi:hypothetical protein
VLAKAEGEDKLEGKRLTMSIDEEELLNGRVSWEGNDRLVIAAADGQETVWRRVAAAKTAANR